MNQNKDGAYRDYVEYEVPNPMGGTPTVIREATWNIDDDIARGFNRAENIHQIPPGDPDFKRLYGRRSDAESINRGVDDDLYLRRAGCLGWGNQLFELICHAMLVNAVTRHRYVDETIEEQIAA